MASAPSPQPGCHGKGALISGSEMGRNPEMLAKEELDSSGGRKQEAGTR